MKIVRDMVSGKVTLLFTALISGLYLYATFGNDNPLNAVLTLMREQVLYRMFFFVVSVHFFLKGMYRLYRGKVRYATSALFFLSLSFFLWGMSHSIGSRVSERLTMGIDDQKGSVKIVDITLDLPGDFLVIGDRFENTIDEPSALIEDEGIRKALRPFPFIRTSSGYMYVNDAGISPRLKIEAKGSSAFSEKMHILPPGHEVGLTIEGGMKASISLWPEKEFKKGRLKARQYSMERPSYRIVVKKGREVLFDGVINDGKEVVDNGITVSSGRTEKWVEVVFVRDRAVYLIYIALIGLIASALLYPIELYRVLFR